MNSGQLVTVVSAVPNTVCAKIAQMISVVNAEKDSSKAINLTIALGGAEGLFLEEVNGGKFTLRYRQSGNLFVLPIGESFPEWRIRHAAESILAMIRRGKGWVSSTGKYFAEAYGMGKKQRSGEEHARRRAKKEAKRRHCRLAR